jgi:hypothetical protein
MQQQSIKSILFNLAIQINAGSAIETPISSELLKQKSRDESDVHLDVSDVNIGTNDLSENLEELFNFIQKNSLASTALVVDSEGLVIAEYGENENLESLTASFPQYIQMMEFSGYTENPNGFWIQNDNSYICVNTVEVNSLAYGIVMNCHKMLSEQQSITINDLFKTVIKKGVNYE